MLGVTFDLGASPMNCSVPEDKVVKATNAIRFALDAVWVPADHCQILLGILTFHGRILLSGKWHLSFTVQGLKRACEFGVALMDALWTVELAWWQELMTVWNRVTILAPVSFTTFEEHPFDTPFTDASRSKQRLKGGAGAVWRHYYMMFQFSAEEVEHLNIMELEGLVVVLWLSWLCENHPDEVTGRRFLARCDNDPFVIDVNSRHSTTPTISFLLGQIHLLQSRFSFDFRLRYVKSKENVCADALSRDDMAAFLRYMQREFDLSPSHLVCVPVQTQNRSSWTSLMISMRRSTESAQTPRGRDSSRPTSSGLGSASGTGSR
jgi:hypothetical protein